MEKPTREECIAWAEECEKKADAYEAIAKGFRGEVEARLASADLWESFAKTRLREANDLRLFARTC